jgi:hypothetical protein
MLCNEARGHLGQAEHSLINDILSNFSTHDVILQIDRVTSLRSNLEKFHLKGNQCNGKMRDLLFLDLALEAYVKTLSDKIISEPIPFKYLCK